MNHALVQRLMDQAVREGAQGQRVMALVKAVAEHCAVICDIVTDNGEPPTAASEIIRAALVLEQPKPSVIAQAARLSLLQ